MYSHFQHKYYYYCNYAYKCIWQWYIINSSITSTISSSAITAIVSISVSVGVIVNVDTVPCSNIIYHITTTATNTQIISICQYK